MTIIKYTVPEIQTIEFNRPCTYPYIIDSQSRYRKLHKTITMYGKPVQLELTDAAQRAADKLPAPLVAEIHLILSCLVVKRIWFKDAPDSETVTVPIAGNLGAGFRVVRYAKSCRISHIDSGEEQPTDFPLVRDKSVFVPHWVRIDFHKNQWMGRFGYDRNLLRKTKLALEIG